MIFPSPGARVVLATHNQGKVGELRALLASYRLALTDAAACSLPEPEETGATFEANAVLKARAAAGATGMAALADDSGLEVAALGGEPGVQSARWSLKPDGSRDFAYACDKVLRALRQGGAAMPAPARFVCAIALVLPDATARVWQGVCDGAIVAEPSGQGGFGYDPIFAPLPLAAKPRTFAAMVDGDPQDKARLSHRARALTAMRQDWEPARRA